MANEGKARSNEVRVTTTLNDDIAPLEKDVDIVVSEKSFGQVAFCNVIIKPKGLARRIEQKLRWPKNDESIGGHATLKPPISGKLVNIGVLCQTLGDLGYTVIFTSCTTSCKDC